MSTSLARGSWLLWLKTVGLLLLVLALFGYIASVPVLFVPFLVAIVLNATLAPVVSALERRDWRRRSAVLLVFAVFAGVLALGALVVPRVAAAEIARAQAMWPEGRARLTELLQSAQHVVNRWVPEGNRVDLVTSVPTRVQEMAQEIIAESPHSMPEVVVAVLLTPLFTFFLLRDGRELKRAMVAAVPNRYFEMTLSILYKVNQQVGNYLRGLLMEAGTDTVIATLLCALFGVPNALIIGVVAGSTTIMPVAGMVISAVICPLIAVFSSTGDPLAVVEFTVLAIVITHTLDNVVVAPLIMGQSVHMHPIAVLVSILLAGRLFGLLGIILAVPTVSILTTVIQEGYRGIRSNEYYLEHT